MKLIWNLIAIGAVATLGAEVFYTTSHDRGGGVRSVGVRARARAGERRVDHSG